MWLFQSIEKHRNIWHCELCILYTFLVIFHQYSNKGYRHCRYCQLSYDMCHVGGDNESQVSSKAFSIRWPGYIACNLQMHRFIKSGAPYNKISQSLESPTVRLICYRSFWNLTWGSATLLQSRLSNFKSIWWYRNSIQFNLATLRDLKILPEDVLSE